MLTKLLISVCRQEELEGQITERYHESARQRRQEEEDVQRAKEDEKDYQKIIDEEANRMRELGFVPKVITKTKLCWLF